MPFYLRMTCCRPVCRKSLTQNHCRKESAVYESLDTKKKSGSFTLDSIDQSIRCLPFARKKKQMFHVKHFPHRPLYSSFPPAAFPVALYPQMPAIGVKNDSAVFVGTADRGPGVLETGNNLRARVPEGIVGADRKDCPNRVNGGDKFGGTGGIGTVVPNLENRALQVRLFSQHLRFLFLD